ncbi:gp436 family protein [Herminiimonas arsenitoxidans]|uniref:gp436 family protein n=1 Tax=Herminiimonas arsenitoxidans TaxID=1809410 RepID=UPI000970C101|nr:phage protein Gp36 family protein [Herminiimonas arsenitoxidans]
MTYATPQDMIAQYGEREMLAIADPDDTGDVDLAKVQLALDSASDQIDFSAGQRCALPLVINTPAVATFLKQLCMDIARYRMTGSSGVTATDEVKDRYKEADGNLKMIMSGKIILCAQSGDGIASGGQGLQPDSLTAGEAESEGAGRMFTSDRLHDYMGRLK